MEIKVMERYNDFLVDCITTFGEKRKCRHSVLFSETRGQENRKRKKKDIHYSKLWGVIRAMKKLWLKF